MSTAESQSLARIHADKLAVFSVELEEMVRSSNYDRAAEMLPLVNQEIQIVAGFVGTLLGSRREEAR